MFQTSPLSPLTAAHTALQHLVGLPPPGVDVETVHATLLCRFFLGEIVRFHSGKKRDLDIERVGFSFNPSKRNKVNGWISRLEASEVKMHRLHLFTFLSFSCSFCHKHVHNQKVIPSNSPGTNPSAYRSHPSISINNPNLSGIKGSS